MSRASIPPTPVRIALAVTLATALGGLARWGLTEVAAVRDSPVLGNLARYYRGPDRQAELLGASAMALVLYGSIVGLLWRRERGTSGAARAARLVLAAGSLAFLAVTVYAGVVHDYHFFNQMWAETRKGNDPWFLVTGIFGGASGKYPFNAYGPLFNLLAPLAGLDVLAPKLLFAYAYLLFVIHTVEALVARRAPGALATLGLLLWFAGPFAWVEIAIRGHFDILMALACVASVDARARGRDAASGVWLGVGVLWKYLPGALLPFLALDGPGKKLRWRLVAWTVGTVALGWAVSCLVWGPSVFRPLTFAANRFPTVLSIWRFIRGQYSPISYYWNDLGLDFLILPVQLLALYRAWMWCRQHGPDPVSAAVLAALTTLLVYQVGFPQYQMVLFALVTYWVVRDPSPLSGNPALLGAVIAYFGWLSAFDLYYCAFDLNARIPVLGITNTEDLVGLPTFLLGCGLLAAVVRTAGGATPGLRLRWPRLQSGRKSSSGMESRPD
jgi:hypothetical protein